MRKHPPTPNVFLFWKKEVHKFLLSCVKSIFTTSNFTTFNELNTYLDMSLTTEALQERKWGQYPALRKILENKELPLKYYGNSSISDNIFEKTNRLLNLFFLVQENEAEVMIKREDKKLIKDLNQLENELKRIEEILAQGIKHLHRIMGQQSL